MGKEVGCSPPHHPRIYSQFENHKIFLQNEGRSFSSCLVCVPIQSIQAELIVWVFSYIQAVLTFIPETEVTLIFFCICLLYQSFRRLVWDIILMTRVCKCFRTGLRGFSCFQLLEKDCRGIEVRSFAKLQKSLQFFGTFTIFNKMSTSFEDKLPTNRCKYPNI